MTASQIYQVLKPSYRSLTPHKVERDVTIVWKELRQAASGVDALEEIGATLAVYEELLREAWGLLSEIADPSDKVRALDTVRSIAVGRLDLMRRLGLLKRPEQAISEVGDTWEERIRRLRQQRGEILMDHSGG
jgi:hypothetical protein